MPIINPTQLVDEFKKSGEFDRLRREMLSQFRSSDGMAQFMARVEDIARQKLESDQKLQYMSEASVIREVMQELDRYPVVERAVADVRALSDPALASGIRESARKILHEDRKDKSQTGLTTLPPATDSTKLNIAPPLIELSVPEVHEEARTTQIIEIASITDAKVPEEDAQASAADKQEGLPTGDDTEAS